MCEEDGDIHDPVVGAFASDYLVLMCYERKVRAPPPGNLHMVMVCAASPTMVALPSRLSHIPLPGGQSSSEMLFASAAGGMESTISLKGCAQRWAKLFINPIRASLVAGTSKGWSRP